MPRAAAPSAAPRPRAAQAPPEPELRLRMRVTLGDANALGPGKIALLEAVDEHRSISAAAKALGMSYRRAWLLVDETNRALTAPAVETAAGGSNGGGTVLTDMGRHVVQIYRGIEAQAAQACRADIDRLLALVAR